MQASIGQVQDCVNRIETLLVVSPTMGPSVDEVLSAMLQLKSHIHDLNESEPVEPDFLATIDTFVDLIEEDHPNAAVIVNKILETLKNIGV